MCVWGGGGGEDGVSQSSRLEDNCPPPRWALGLGGKTCGTHVAVVVLGNKIG